MSDIGQFVIPPTGTAAREMFERLFPKPPAGSALAREIQRRFDAARALIICQQENGTGLEADSTLRYFHNEYNYRAIYHGLHAMPSSLNVMEAFHEFTPDLFVFRLRRQLDHLFSVPDFLDRLTQGELEAPLDEAIELLEEGVVYNFENAANPASLRFSIETGDKFGFAAISLVRHGSEVSALVVAGQETDLAKQTELLRAGLEIHRAMPGKENIVPAPDRALEAVPLGSECPLWKTLVLSRFNIAKHSQQVRYVMQDCGNGYITLTDDPDCFLDERGNFVDPSDEGLLESLTERLRQYGVLFELSSSFLYLPLYLDKYGEKATEERRITHYGEKRNKKEYRRTLRQCPAEERIAFRRVTVLTSTGEPIPARSTYLRTPDLRVEKSGYWRRLPPGRVGTDANGNAVHGRTWVEKRLAWTEGDSPAVLSLSHAPVQDGSDAELTGPDPGWIYVMRSASHPRNVFKIGLTRRTAEERAKELSSNTAVVDGFYVFHEWPVRDCKEAEAKIHSTLAAFRVSPTREFFDLPLQKIVRVITDVIAAQGG